MHLQKIQHTLLVVLFFSSSNWAQTWSIAGQFSEATDSIQLLAFDANQEKYLPIAKIDLDQNYKFTWQGAWKYANLYQLKVGEKELQTFAVDQPEQIQVDIKKAKEGTYRVSVNGSTGTNLLKWFPKKIRSLEAQYFGELKPKLDAAIEAKDQEKINAIQQKVGQLFPAFVADIRAAAVDSLGTSVAAYPLLGYVDPQKGLPIIEEMVSQFLEKQPDLPISRLLARKLAGFQGLGIGVAAPNFELVDLDGKTVKLSAYQGKFTYVDFWASWCLACRAENPNWWTYTNSIPTKTLACLG